MNSNGTRISCFLSIVRSFNSVYSSYVHEVDSKCKFQKQKKLLQNTLFTSIKHVFCSKSINNDMAISHNTKLDALFQIGERERERERESNLKIKINKTMQINLPVEQTELCLVTVSARSLTKMMTMPDAY